MASTLLTLGEPGLTKPDLGLRFYLSGVRVPSTEAGLTITEIPDSGGDYHLLGLPDHPGATDLDVYEVTWESPEGVGGFYVYPERVRPPKLVIPLRETGLTAADFDLALYVDQSPVDASSVTVTEAVPGAGDYVLAGWSSAPGSWRLVWRYAGLTYSYAWEVPGSASGVRFIEILALQRPFPFSLDEHSRHMYSANYIATVEHPAVELEEAIVAILADAGLATSNVDTFIGLGTVLPIGDHPGPFTTIVDTGGTSPLETHDGAKLDRASAQIIVRAKDAVVARARAQAIYAALDGKRDIVVATA